MSQITTHILDTAAGTPASGVHLSLFRESPSVAHASDDYATIDSTGHAQSELLARGVTNEDGRVPNLLPAGETLAAGIYRMHFATGAYLERDGGEAFYPHVDVVFRLDEKGEHYHIPLLLSPFGYSTYRGS